MRFVNDYKNRGGTVTVGSDSGFIYNLYGFGYIQELELLREAGFSALEVIHAATQAGAEALGPDDAIAREDNVIGTLRGCAGAVAERNVAQQHPLIGADAPRAGGDRIGEGRGRGGSCGTWGRLQPGQ